MPAGTYEHVDTGGRVRLVERFRCAAGGSGWRYVSGLSTPDSAEVGSVDLTLDLRGPQLRVAVDLGGWSVRGGVTGPEVVWVRRAATGSEAEEHRDRALGFIGVSPAFLVATAATVPRNGDAVRFRLLALSDVLGVRRQEERWRLIGTDSHYGEGGTVDVSVYERIDADTAERTTIHVAGDVVLAAGSVGLAELDSPPGPALHERG